MWLKQAMSLIAILLIASALFGGASCIIQKADTSIRVTESYDEDTGQLVVYAKLTYTNVDTGQTMGLGQKELKFILNYTTVEGEKSSEFKAQTDSSGKASVNFVIPGAIKHTATVVFAGDSAFKESVGTVGGTKGTTSFETNLPKDINLTTCMPLLLLIGFLGAAMYASGRNPFGMVDFTASRGITVQRRMIKAYQIGWAIMFGTVGGILSAIGTKLTGAKAEGEVEKEKEKKPKEEKKEKAEQEKKVPKEGGMVKGAMPFEKHKKEEALASAAPPPVPVGQRVALEAPQAVPAEAKIKLPNVVPVVSWFASALLVTGAILSVFGGNPWAVKEFKSVKVVEKDEKGNEVVKTRYISPIAINWIAEKKKEVMDDLRAQAGSITGKDGDAVYYVFDGIRWKPTTLGKDLERLERQKDKYGPEQKKLGKQKEENNAKKASLEKERDRISSEIKKLKDEINLLREEKAKAKGERVPEIIEKLNKMGKAFDEADKELNRINYVINEIDKSNKGINAQLKVNERDAARTDDVIKTVKAQMENNKKAFNEVVTEVMKNYRPALEKLGVTEAKDITPLVLGKLIEEESKKMETAKKEMGNEATRAKATEAYKALEASISRLSDAKGALIKANVETQAAGSAAFIVSEMNESTLRNSKSVRRRGEFLCKSTPEQVAKADVAEKAAQYKESMIALGKIKDGLAELNSILKDRKFKDLSDSEKKEVVVKLDETLGEAIKAANTYYGPTSKEASNLKELNELLLEGKISKVNEGIAEFAENMKPATPDVAALKEFGATIGISAPNPLGRMEAKLGNMAMSLGVGVEPGEVSQEIVEKRVPGAPPVELIVERKLPPGGIDEVIKRIETDQSVKESRVLANLFNDLSVDSVNVGEKTQVVDEYTKGERNPESVQPPKNFEQILGEARNRDYRGFDLKPAHYDKVVESMKNEAWTNIAKEHKLPVHISKEQEEFYEAKKNYIDATNKYNDLQNSGADKQDLERAERSISDAKENLKQAEGKFDKFIENMGGDVKNKKAVLKSDKIVEDWANANEKYEKEMKFLENPTYIEYKLRENPKKTVWIDGSEVSYDDIVRNLKFVCYANTIPVQPAGINKLPWINQ